MTTRTKNNLDESSAEKTAKLLRTYGGLLTERQRLLAEAHYENRKSLSQIAREQNVSRQAVHDAIRHAGRLLEEYDSKLGLLIRGGAPEENARPDVDALRDRLERLKQRVAHQGIIYSVDWILQDLNGTISMLEESQRP